MRDFSVTAEPSGKASSKGKPQPAGKGKQGGLPFVIQKHAASHLHYDFRLGWNGVLKSWAVTKGPSYFTGDKRLAVQVEDHPIEYGGFEGIIPKGQYGGGTVMVWDQGTWEPQAGHEDVDEGLRTGSLKFTMHGTKMKGNWALVRMGGRAANAAKPNWLLIKERDDFARGKDDPCITEEAPDSAVTGRSLEQIASEEDHVWNSKDTAEKDKPWYRQNGSAQNQNGSTAAAAKDGPAKKATQKKATQKKALNKKARDFDASLKGIPREMLPAFIKPELAVEAVSPTDLPGWVHELKLDGYRIQARKDGDNVKLLTRTGLDWTHRMKPIAAAIAELAVRSALLDGEVVVLSENGTTSFANLQAAFQEGANHPLTYFVFDVLHLNGANLRDLPLSKRKQHLARVIEDAGEALHLSEFLEENGEAMFLKACELHAEGIISKRAQSRYISGRGSDWQKFKCIHEQEFVIGGFTLPSNGSHGIGALLLGVYEGERLVYAGRTGTGFTQETHRILRGSLDALRDAQTPFDHPPAEATRKAIWVKPELVAQVRFANWTAEDLLRQAAFQGLREDKPATEVRREEASPIPKKRKSSKEMQETQTSSDLVPDAHPGDGNSAKAVAAPVRLTHPDKVLDAASGLTKQQLADYFWAVAPHMLPHIEGRPLSLVRCPEGSGKPCFFQKHTNHTLPPGVESVDVPDKKTGKPEPYITLATPEALAGLAQMGVLEVHPWSSRNDDLEHPDRIIFDLDPDTEIPWKTLAGSADEVRKALKSLGLESFLKLTGGKGLHVVVPIVPQNSWDAVKGFSHQFVLAIEQQNPSLYLTKMTKSARKGKIYLDYLRNERGATAVAPFSPRAREGAQVSLPLPWSDLKLDKLPVFRVADFASWRSRLAKDPWKSMPTLKQKLAKSA
jgi:bifunctional non-homologous end joining protein LigD